MNLKSQGISAFIWDFVGKLAAQGTGFVVTIFLARLLEPSDFGLIAMIMVIVGIAQIFTDVGLGSALIQSKKVTKRDYSSVFFFNLAIASCLSFLFYLASDYIADFYQNENLSIITKTISFLFFINALSSVQVIRLRRGLKFSLLSKASFISSVLSGVLGVSCAYYHYGVWSLVIQILTQALLFNVLIWSLSRWHPSFSFSFNALQRLWGFGFRMFISNLISAIFSRLDFIIIGKAFSAETLGYFQRAKQFNGLITQYTSGSLMAVMFPVLSKVQHDLVRFKSITLNTLNTLCFVVFLLIGSVYLITTELIVILFTGKWLPSVQYMEILLLSSFAYPLSALLVNVLSSKGNSKDFLKLEIIKKSFLSINFVSAIYFGIEAYLYGLVLVSLINISINIYFVKKELGLPFLLLFKPIVQQMCIALVFILSVTYITADLQLNFYLFASVKVTLFIFCYILANYLLKTKPYIVTTSFVIPLASNFTHNKQR